MAGNIGTIRYGELLLRSMSSACELFVTEDELSSKQGVAIVRDAQQGVFANIVKASGTDSAFKIMHAKFEPATKNPANRNRFEKGYPCNRQLAGIGGNAKGVFSNLEILVGVKTDSKGNNKCLTRPDNSVFTWS